MVFHIKKCWSITGVTTSGIPNKHPGRVGDSPLPGCGLYAGKYVSEIHVHLYGNHF